MLLYLLSGLALSKATILNSEEKSFVSFMRSNNVFYTGDEYAFRLGVFVTNLRRVQEFNKKGSKYLFKVGMNPFFALTPTEISQYLKGAKGDVSQIKNSPYLKDIKTLKKVTNDVPDSFDWRDTPNIVGSIKEQGSCGSCWAFSTITVQESRWAIVKGKKYILSEQELIDCVTTCYGCNGGLPTNAIKYIIENQNGHFDQNYLYPNRYKRETCKYDSSHDVSLVTGFVQIKAGDEEELKEKIATIAPVSILIDSSPWSFVYYQSGIYNDEKCSKTFIDHAVALVGYGIDENNTEFWILRNSWGTKWGEEGYMRIQRNAGGVCGLASNCIIPTVE